MPKRNKNKKNPFDANENSNATNESEAWQEFLDAVDKMSDEEVQNKIDAEQSEPEKNFSSPRKNIPVVKLDLHGLKLDEAKRVVITEVESRIQNSESCELNIITGKGRHSDEGKGVLVHEIYKFMRERFRGKIKFLDSDPGESLLDGRPIRGHFRVRIGN